MYETNRRNRCRLVFDPEACDADGKEKRATKYGEFLSAGRFSQLSIYTNDPVKALSNLDHEGTHFIQRVKLAKSFPKVDFNNVDFDKFIAINMVFEADAFSRQIEYAYFDREHPEKFSNLKKSEIIYNPLAEIYEKTYKACGDKNKAYTATFNEVFKNKDIAKFYSKYYTDQYLNMEIYKNPKRGDVNIARMVQILSDKRYKRPDDVMAMVTDNFVLSDEDWNEINVKNSEYETKYGRGDNTYTKFKVRYFADADDYSRLKDYMEFVIKNNKVRKGDVLGDAVRLAQRRAWRTVCDYEKGKIPITSDGNCKKEMTIWISRERKHAARDNNKEVLAKLLEVEHFMSAIDIRKTVNAAALSMLRRKELRYNRNPRKTGGVSPVSYSQNRQM